MGEQRFPSVFPRGRRGVAEEHLAAPGDQAELRAGSAHIDSQQDGRGIARRPRAHRGGKSLRDHIRARDRRADNDGVRPGFERRPRLFGCLDAPFGDDRSLYGADKVSNKTRLKCPNFAGVVRVAAQRGKHGVRPRCRGLDGFLHRRDVGKRRHVQLVFDLPQPFQSAETLSPARAIERNEVGARLYQLLRRCEGWGDENAAVRLHHFLDADNGNLHRLANRLNVLTPTGTDAGSAARDRGSRKTRHRVSIAKGMTVRRLAGNNQFLVQPS